MELVTGHQMNHDFQFFYAIVAHPEVARFLDRVKAWFHMQLHVVGEDTELERLRQKEQTIAEQDNKEKPSPTPQEEVQQFRRRDRIRAQLPAFLREM